MSQRTRTPNLQANQRRIIERRGRLAAPGLAGFGHRPRRRAAAVPGGDGARTRPEPRRRERTLRALPWHERERTTTTTNSNKKQQPEQADIAWEREPSGAADWKSRRCGTSRRPRNLLAFFYNNKTIRWTSMRVWKLAEKNLRVENRNGFQEKKVDSKPSRTLMKQNKTQRCGT